MAAFAERVRELRKERGLKQTEIFGKRGIGYGNIEKGKKSMLYFCVFYLGALLGFLMGFCNLLL